MENENINTPIDTETTPTPSQPAEAAETPAIIPDQPLPTSEPIPTPPSSPIPESAPSPIKNLLLKAKEMIQFRKRAKLEKILVLAGEKGKITNNDIEKLLHVSDATATRYLSQLVKEGRLKRVGTPERARYEPL